jgi:hypothetical protein
MNSSFSYLKMMNRSVRHAGRIIRQKRCHHSDFLCVPNILHRQWMGQDRPARAAAPQTVRAAMVDEVIHEAKL